MSLLVVDTSAIVAYARGSVHVGEPMSEAGDSGSLVVVPVVCLIEAARQVGEEMLLHVLADHPISEVTPLLAKRWEAVASGVRVLERLDIAVALLEATTRDGLLLTAEPEAYGAPGEDYIIPLES